MFTLDFVNTGRKLLGVESTPSDLPLDAAGMKALESTFLDLLGKSSGLDSAMGMLGILEKAEFLKAFRKYSTGYFDVESIDEVFSRNFSSGGSVVLVEPLAQYNKFMRSEMPDRVLLLATALILGSNQAGEFVDKNFMKTEFKFTPAGAKGDVWTKLFIHNFGDSVPAAVTSLLNMKDQLTKGIALAQKMGPMMSKGKAGASTNRKFKRFN